jgi:hypothetical protein
MVMKRTISDFFMYQRGIYHKTNLARQGANQSTKPQLSL